MDSLSPNLDSLSHNLDSLSHNLFVRDIRSTIEFYKILGFHLIMSVPGENEGELVWAMVTSGKVSFMFPEFSITDPNNFLLTFAEDEGA
jgi:hypothetical protein